MFCVMWNCDVQDVGSIIGKVTQRALTTKLLQGLTPPPPPPPLSPPYSVLHTGRIDHQGFQRAGMDNNMYTHSNSVF